MTPTGAPQRFEVHETFFSMTDAAGVIRDGNEVFARVSGHPFDRLIGANHNLIRHPGVPRAVFHLLWKTVKQGATFMGYVNNLAANANHYWVMAVVVPLEDGYLSVRIKPTSARLKVVEDLYVGLLAWENQQIAAGKSEGAVAAAGAERLLQQLAGAGWSDYAAFSHDSLIREIKARDSALANSSGRLFPATLSSDAEAALLALHGHAGETYAKLNEIFTQLDHFLEGSAAVVRYQRAVAEIGDAFQISALNAHLAAHPLGTAGQVIGTVANFLNDHARQLSRHMRALAGHISVMATAVSDITSNVCAARIQMEMILSFAAEMAQAADRNRSAGQRVRQLRDACGATGLAAARAIGLVLERLPQLRDDRERLRKDIVALQAAQVTGLTEAARLGLHGPLQDMFAEMRRQVNRTAGELEKLGDSINGLFQLTRDTPAAVDALVASLARLGSLALCSSDAVPATSLNRRAGPPSG